MGVVRILLQRIALTSNLDLTCLKLVYVVMGYSRGKGGCLLDWRNCQSKEVFIQPITILLYHNTGVSVDRQDWILAWTDSRLLRNIYKKMLAWCWITSLYWIPSSCLVDQSCCPSPSLDFLLIGVVLAKIQPVLSVCLFTDFPSLYLLYAWHSSAPLYLLVTDLLFWPVITRSACPHSRIRSSVIKHTATLRYFELWYFKLLLRSNNCRWPGHNQCKHIPT